MNSTDFVDPARVQHLRDMALEGRTIAEMIHFLRFSLGPISGFSVAVLMYFKQAFNLTLAETMPITGAFCMGNEAISNGELNLVLRPLILERLSSLDT